MTEVLARRSLEEPAGEEALEHLHVLLDELWLDAAFVPPTDQMAFTTAVIEAASNAVQHGVPTEGSTLHLGVELTVETTRLRAIISEIGAKELDPVPDLDAPLPTFPPADEASPAELDESGRGLSMIRALVTTVTVERQGDTNVWVLSRDSPQDGRPDPA